MPCEAAAKPATSLRVPFVAPDEGLRAVDVYTSGGSFYTYQGTRGIVTAQLFRGDRMVWVLLGTGKARSTDAPAWERTRRRMTATGTVRLRDRERETRCSRPVRFSGYCAATSLPSCRRRTLRRRARRIPGERVMSTATILLIVILVLLIVGLPTWPYSRGWGYFPSGILGTILIIVLLMMIFGML